MQCSAAPPEARKTAGALVVLYEGRGSCSMAGHGGWPRRMMIPVLGVLLDGPEREMDGLQILVAAALPSRAARPGVARLDGGFGGLASPCPGVAGFRWARRSPCPGPIDPTWAPDAEASGDS